MTTQTDLVSQVAEAKCPNIYPWTNTGEDIHQTGCADCQGTGLRWPTLSRSLVWVVAKLAVDTSEFKRVPDCSLEKVLDIFFDLHLQPRFCRMNDGTIRIDLYGDVDGNIVDSAQYRKYEATAELAACAALLACV